MRDKEKDQNRDKDSYKDKNSYKVMDSYKYKDRELKEVISPPQNRSFLSREEAARRARQKRLGENSAQAGAEDTPRAGRAAGGEIPRGHRNRNSHALEGERPDTRKNRSSLAEGGESPDTRRNRNSRARADKGARTSKKAGARRRVPPVPLLAAALILFCALFVFPGIVPRVFFRLVKTIGRDSTPPVIELVSDPSYVVYPGQEYEEEGYRAVDDRDGDLTEKVSRTVKDGVIYYSVTDEAGNTSRRSRQIPYAEVSSNIQSYSTAKELAKMRESFPKADSAASGSGKIIYLTFDDGPGQYTERLLETLSRYGVHATFFVTAAKPDCEDLIKKEYEAGHSIGIHTYSHDFDKIFADTDAFWKDIEKMQQIVVRQTGHPTNLLRFAGGSSNTAGTWQSPGIMEELISQMPKKGFQYFDWNVSSGDGAQEGDSAMVISRITSQIQNYDESVVLCHDTKEYTVNAMEYLIPWLLDNGYTLLPLSFTSEPAHHYTVQ